ncbi:MAG: hypothetical protein HBSAPP03_26170 [Phycisphaerae bacterium]|nr:MAG: hypothetical protein HBSAPP03_26170 [Phycisphaerae bacterium]
MTRDSRIQLLAGVCLAACLAASTVLAVSLTAIAGRAKLTYTDRAEEGQPVEVSIGIALGAFRGVFVNMLWIRAEEMKNEGKYYEAVQLADMITRLQPRFPRVWVFHAWNLAYNISVGTNTKEERWQWVNAGIDLLRRRGVPANPNDLLIHKELGWIFLHKIGGYTDDANPHYKRMMAREWTIVMGPPPERSPDDRDRAKAIARRVAWLEQFRDAPDSLDAVIAKEPGVEALGRALTGAGIENTRELLTRYEMWRAMQKSGQREAWKRSAGPKTRAFGAVVDDPAYAKAWPALLFFVRKQMLIHDYNMEIDRMIQYTKDVGPLDWRHYAAHALYWTQKGVDSAYDRMTAENRKDFDFINTDRVVAQACQELFRTGDLYFDFLSSSFPDRHAIWNGIPNVHYVEAYQRMMDPMRRRSSVDDGGRRGTTPLSAGYENFLRDAVCFYYASGDMANAEKWRTEMLTYKYVNLNDRERREIWARSWDEFIEHELVGELERPSVAIGQAAAGLIQAYAGGLLGGDRERFLKGMEWAKMVHRKFFEAQHRVTIVDPTTPRMEQMPEDFQILAGTQFVMFLSTVSLDDAEAVYDAAPDDLRAYAYDMLTEQYKEELDKMAAADPDKKVRPFDATFPKPQSLDEVRAKMAAYIARRSRPGVDIERK